MTANRSGLTAADLEDDRIWRAKIEDLLVAIVAGYGGSCDLPLAPNAARQAARRGAQEIIARQRSDFDYEPPGPGGPR